jgi:hypothetical protein
MTETAGASAESIAGYDFGSARSARSPVSMEQLRHLEETLGWAGDDERLLRKHSELFRSRLNTWWTPSAQSSVGSRISRNGFGDRIPSRTTNTTLE